MSFWSRGVGEIGLVPTAPAIAGAMYKSMELCGDNCR